MNEEKKDLVAMNVGQDVPMVFEGPTGLENFDADCMTIPYLRVAQAGSDQVKRGSPKYIEGLQAGQFFSPLTRQVFGDEMRLVVLKFYRSFTIYDREGTDAKIIGTMSAEQFKRDIEPFTTRVGRDGRTKSYNIDSEGHRYVDNRNFLCMDYDRPENGMFLFPLQSTGIKPSKQWGTMLNSQKARRPDGSVVDAPIWSSVWKLKVGYFQGDGNSWYQIGSVERLGWVEKGAVAEMYKKAFESVQGLGVHDIVGAGDEADGEPQAAPAPQASPANAAVNAVNGAFARPARPQAAPAASGTDDEQTF